MKNPMDISLRNLSKADLRRTVKVCEQLHQADANKSFTKHVHTVMKPAFSNVHFSSELYQFDPFTLLEQELHTVDDHLLPIFKEYMLDHPYASRLFTQTAPELSMTQLEPTLKKFLKTPLYNEFYAQIEAQNQMWIGIRDGNELLTCLYSGEHEYTENDFAMMHILQPHLELAWKHWRQTRALKQELEILKDSISQSKEQEAAAAQLRRMIDTLPPRQRKVVELVAGGLDNQKIANELKISIRTVQKHLELIFQSMAVQHRTELAAKWHQAHSVRVY